MSNVTLEIAARKYTIACAEGEEAHIEMLGASIDAKLAQLDNLAGQSPERILLYATLLLADELHEAKGLAPPTIPAAADDTAATEAATQLESLAGRLESLAMRIENA